MSSNGAQRTISSTLSVYAVTAKAVVFADGVAVTYPEDDKTELSLADNASPDLAPVVARGRARPSPRPSPRGAAYTPRTRGTS